jgi:hypothetical protein
MDNNTLAREIVKRLNELLVDDNNRRDISELVARGRISTTDKDAALKSKLIYNAEASNDNLTLGFLGVLNGIAATDTIAVELDDQGNAIRFLLVASA